VFTIGTTTARCSASNPDENDNPVTVSFTGTVKDGAAQLAHLY